MYTYNRKTREKKKKPKDILLTNQISTENLMDNSSN